MKTKFIHPIIMIGPTRSGKSCVAKILANTGYYTNLFEPITIWDIGRSGRCQDDTRRAEEATPQTIDAIRQAIAKRMAGVTNDRFVDDLPHHTLRFDFCQKVLPEARYIFVTRDASGAIPCMRYGWEYRDTLGKLAQRRLGKGRYRSINVAQLVKPAFRWSLNAIRSRLGQMKVSWGPTVPGQVEFARLHSPIETIAYQWAKMVEYAQASMDSAPDNSVLKIRSEDLWEQPHVLAAKLAEFCELPFKDVVTATDLYMTKATFNGVQTPLSDQEWKQIWPIIKDHQQRQGYTPPLAELQY